MADEYPSIADQWMRRYEEEHLNATRLPLQQADCLSPQQVLDSAAMQSKNHSSACLWIDCYNSAVGLDPIVVLAIQARKALRLTQMSFSRRLGISVRTLRDWEQGRRQPSGAARTLLKWVAEQPELVSDEFRSQRKK
ncbi:helix-turn-helix domain-containing protein [uncultured Amphritea sp.]|uniref:helix-turn-helix domain-containing protein n=1 Tax=uncultured Amphritea sp. TaxID=981605 RepID=UPI00261B95D4|nr:helix-turn-helix domain-containing protein [uncultured Amphritea sp.]